MNPMYKWFAGYGWLKVLIGFGLLALLFGWALSKTQHNKINEKKVVSNMQISSDAIQPGDTIPVKYTCDGDNVNPPLQFQGIPGDTKSLALIVDDPDAPNGTFTHWLVWNIEPSTTQIAENSVPNGAIQGKTGFGKNSYGGPCPPNGSHTYHFKLYALDSRVSLDPDSTTDQLMTVIKSHTLTSADMAAPYEHAAH